MRGSASIVIEATPEAVYALVSDVPRLGGLGPECYRCEWNNGVGEPRVGTSFTGYNRLGDFEWSTQCVITAADPGRLFAYEIVRPGVRYSRWTYIFEPGGAGTRVTESFEVMRLPSALKGSNGEQLAQRERMLVDGMRQTLATLKRALESPG
ncbi:MAG: SRPBCC family protein [Egibacteraceae bacterium]